MALKNIMRVDNGNVVGADTEARNFINNNLITSVNGTDVEFKFIYDSTQDKFGYRDASGTFVPFESGGDFSQLIYENLAAANIKKGVTINVKDPDGNLLNGATGSYEVNTFTNLTAANIKKGIAVTIKDSAGATLKSVTGTYSAPVKSFKITSYPFMEENGYYLRCRLYISNIQNISSMTIVSACNFQAGSYNLLVQKNGTTVAQTSDTSYTVTGLTNGSYINAYSGWEPRSYGDTQGSVYLQVSSFS